MFEKVREPLGWAIILSLIAALAGGIAEDSGGPGFWTVFLWTYVILGLVVLGLWLIGVFD